jgi:minor extracellular serine protease Vpr
LALFLTSIGNPAPYTVNGYAQDGKCRPKFSLVKNIFQSAANTIKIYNSTLFSTTVMQGAGLVNVYQAITTTTIFSPSELGLNDTVRRATSYRVSVINIGSETAVYKMSHNGAALATGKSADDDQLLGQPVYTEDYAVSLASEIDIKLKDY